MYMTSLRLLATNEGVSVPVNMLGKWKTLTMMAGIPLLMAHEPWSLFPSIPMSLVGSILVYVAGIISLWSAIVYTYNMIQKLKQLRVRKSQQKKSQVGSADNDIES
jgi:phosphatidylglycerophosphate synthase